MNLAEPKEKLSGHKKHQVPADTFKPTTMVAFPLGMHSTRLLWLSASREGESSTLLFTLAARFQLTSAHSSKQKLCFSIAKI